MPSVCFRPHPRPCLISGRSSCWIAVAALLIASVPVWAERDDPYESVNRSWDRFGSVYGRVLENYYAPVDHDEIMRAAIEGMLRRLDAYSQYFDAEGLRQLRQDTTGKFAGLGITVGIKDHHPVVISPIEGTPASRAGLEPGDLIVAIEGSDTFGMTLEDVVNALRGEPGTSARITIDRRGVQANWDVVIVREVITLRSVAVADEIAPGIGYISMRQTRFSEDTSTEVESSLEQLSARGVHGLILDLRGNPGGLLRQATEVADLFLPRGAPVVTVRERAGRREETKHSQRRPPAGDMPLVVLIDGGSASASEIVAGAIQDNDRGVILGTTSFGKGSVQTIFDLREATDAALKLTTALYYTPSGRSIHRQALTTTQDLAMQVSFGDVSLPAGLLLSVLSRAPDVTAAEDRLRARFDLDEATARQVLTTPLGDLVGRDASPADSDTVVAETYHTLRGRLVYGGGGITPDIVVEPDVAPPYVQELYRHRVFFDFVVEYVGDELGTDPRAAGPSAEVDDTMLQAFLDYLPRSAAAEAKRRQARDELTGLRDLAAESGWNGDVLARVDSLEAAIDRHASTVDLEAADMPYMRAGLRRELAARVEGRSASLLIDLDADPQVQEAIHVLQDDERLAHILRRDD